MQPSIVLSLFLLHIFVFVFVRFEQWRWLHSERAHISGDETVETFRREGMNRARAALELVASELHAIPERR